MSSSISYSYLYRVLRPDEDPKVGIIAAAPLSSASVSEHVECGRLPTQYISTCATESSAIQFANLGLIHGDLSPERIITIDVDLLKASSYVSFIDLTNDYIRNRHISLFSTANHWASDWDEVLITGSIPASCITNVREISG